MPELKTAGEPEKFESFVRLLEEHPHISVYFSGLVASKLGIKKERNALTNEEKAEVSRLMQSIMRDYLEQYKEIPTFADVREPYMPKAIKKFIEQQGGSEAEKDQVKTFFERVKTLISNRTSENGSFVALSGQPFVR